MTMTKEETTRRAAMLKQARERHQESVERTRALLKDQQAFRREICKQLRERPKTVPEIAEGAALPAHRVLWHITAMKKYGLVVEAGQCGEYYLYKMVKEIEA